MHSLTTPVSLRAGTKAVPAARTDRRTRCGYADGTGIDAHHACARIHRSKSRRNMRIRWRPPALVPD